MGFDIVSSAPASELGGALKGGDFSGHFPSQVFCQREGIHPGIYYKWSKAFVQSKERDEEEKCQYR